jgi:hypothetical protein
LDRFSGETKFFQDVPDDASMVALQFDLPMFGSSTAGKFAFQLSSKISQFDVLAQRRESVRTFPSFQE